MPLFRRKQQGKEEPASEPRTGSPASGRSRRTGGPKAPSAGPVAATVSPAVTAAPPPLPAPPPPLAPTLETPPDYSECFVCGSNLEGKTCPKCRMTWTE